MLNKVLPRSITAESPGARCCAGKISGPRPSRCPAYKMYTAKGPQRHRDTKAQRRAIKCDFSSRASVPLCLCVFVVPVIRHSGSEQELQTKLNLPWSVVSRHCC